MRLDGALVRHLADLAGLPVGDSELDGLVAEMQRLVSWVDLLPAEPRDVASGARPGEDPEPAAAMSLGKDEPHACLDRELVRQMAPSFDDGFVVVPCVLPEPEPEPEAPGPGGGAGA